MKVVFSGDLFLGGDLINHDLKDSIKVDKFHKADIRIVNLEHPISDNNEVAKKGVLYTNTSVLRNLKKSKIDAVCLANNHIHDKLDEGIIDTITNLEKSDIGFFGAGIDLEQAKKPFWLTESLCVLGYCQFDSPTLNNIQLAGKNSPGVNPLIEQRICSDLELLPNDAKAILYFHWGREHVWLTQHKNLDLAGKLLKNDKVALVLGTHPHRVQGYLVCKAKRAYLSIGNFLFPNFYIKPLTEVVNDYSFKALGGKVDITRQYHSVSKMTYKKWRFVNRVSQIVEYDTETNRVEHLLVFQDDNYPIVKELKGIRKWIFIGLINYLNFVYAIPKGFYVFMEKICSFVRFKIWNAQVIFFKIRQNGLVESIRKRFNLL